MAVLSSRTPFRILVIDNEPEILTFLTEQFEVELDDGQLELLAADNEHDGRDLFVEKFVDLIVLDLHFPDPTGRGEGHLGGAELYRELETLRASVDIVMVTGKNLRNELPALFSAASRSTRPHVIDFVDKRTRLESLTKVVRERVTLFQQAAVSVDRDDALFVADLILRRRMRYPKAAPMPRSEVSFAVTGPEPSFLRRSTDEIAVEVERLCDDLFGNRRGIPDRTAVRVEMQRLDRRGLSAAVTVKPLVHLALHDVERETEGFQCILKVGPVADIAEEVDRFQEYVRYGVELPQRVELLAHAYRDALGGIVYSFAGGVGDECLLSLDEVLRQSDADVSAKVLESLFATTHWYSVSAKKARVLHYFDTEYQTNLAHSLDTNASVLRRIGEELGLFAVEGDPERSDTTVRWPEGSNFVLPGREFLGEGWSARSYERCLVHGDMHGGNVLAVLDSGTAGQDDASRFQRACLIDYRNAGPGPRCIDAAALETSIRIADAEVVARQVNPVGAVGLSQAELREALQMVVRRLDPERQFHDYVWDRRKSAGKEQWAILGTVVVQGLRRTFGSDKLSEDEYIETSILYLMRQLGYSQIDAVVRLRLCVRLAALYGQFRRQADVRVRAERRKALDPVVSDANDSERPAPSVFLSYSHRDKPLARRIATGLTSHGYRVWLDEGEMVAGDSLVRTIAEAVMSTDYLVALVSPASINSGWCGKELALGVAQGIEQVRAKVLPVRVGDVVMPPELGDVLYIAPSDRDGGSVIEDLRRAIVKHEERRGAPSREPAGEG